MSFGLRLNLGLGLRTGGGGTASDNLRTSLNGQADLEGTLQGIPRNLAGNLTGSANLTGDVSVIKELTGALTGSADLVGEIETLAAWTPAEITTALWLDAADASTITLNGSNVSQWNDKSGNNNHVVQSTAANQPAYGTRTLNGKNVVEFSGNQMLFSTESVVSGNPDVLMALVIQYDTNVNFDDRSMQLSDGQGTSYAITGGSDGYSSRFNNGNEKYGPTSLATSLIQVGTRPSGGDYASSQMFINGTESTRTAGGSDARVPNIGNGVSIGAGAISSSIGTIDGAMDGYVAEAMIVSDVALATRQKLEGYLAHKWGLTANLPASHPYKSTPPTV